MDSLVRVKELQVLQHSLPGGMCTGDPMSELHTSLHTKKIVISNNLVTSVTIQFSNRTVV